MTSTIRTIFWFGLVLGLTVFAHTGLRQIFPSLDGYTPWFSSLCAWLMICTTAFYCYEKLPSLPRLVSRRLRLIGDRVVVITLGFILVQHAFIFIDADAIENITALAFLCFYYASLRKGF